MGAPDDRAWGGPLGGLLALLYGAAVGLRAMAYDAGILPVSRVAVPVLSVGNMTAGGTGKTPMVELLLRELLPTGKRVAVVSRGYGRAGTGQVVVSDGNELLAPPDRSGDEPFQIARKFPRAIVIVDGAKARAAATAVARLGAEIVLVDDGFQHRALARDLDIVLVDSTTPLRTMRLLPAGMRREPLSGLARAGVVVYTRCDSPAHAHEGFPEASGAAVCCVRTRVSGLRRVADGAALEPGTLRGSAVVAFCGIGAPGSFRAMLASLGCEVREFFAFADHAPLAPRELERIAASAAAHGAAWIVTTEKDAVRLAGDEDLRAAAPPGLAALEIEQEFTRGGEAFRSLVRAVALGGRAA